jgi:preprotein translocase subunit SecE
LDDSGGARFLLSRVSALEFPGASGAGAGKQAAGVGGSTAIGTIGNDTMAKASPFKFMQEVRQEVAKVTWPSRRETTITTIMVFVFATAAGLFFLLADQVIRMTVTLLLGIGN